jgi:hypothetical protein
MRSDLSWYSSRVAMEGREALVCKGEGWHDDDKNVGLWVGKEERGGNTTFCEL